MRRKGMPMKKQAKVSEKDFDEELSVSESRMNRKAARKKRILRNRLLFLGVILLIVGAILFRFLVVARTVNVTNETPYSDEQLLASMKEGKGSFLFSFNHFVIKNILFHFKFPLKYYFSYNCIVSRADFSFNCILMNFKNY